MRPIIAIALLIAAGCRSSGGDPDPDGDNVNTNDGDCEPFNAAIAPGVAEACNGLDDDCDGVVDVGAADATAFYVDVDGDGYGDVETPVLGCVAPTGAVANASDCDDVDPSVHPGAPESDCEDPTDRNCDGSVGFADADEDGVPACNDCDDDAADAFPGNAESCDGADNDCDGAIDDDATDGSTFYVDLDDDGAGSDRFTLVACEAPSGYVAAADDCDDLDATSAPGLKEACDGADNDCNGTPDDGVGGEVSYYLDADADGYGDVDNDITACTQPVGYARNFDDCDDARGDVHPGATEVSCKDTTDYNCDGSVGAEDSDADGFQACEDCDDGDKNVYAGATEACDERDNDCDGEIDELAPTWYADIDGDGRGGTRLTAVACAAPGGFVASKDDCDDLSASVLPGAEEACDGADSDCDGKVSGEGDGDSDGALACEDCDDGDAAAYPGGVEICDAKDNDCDGAKDDAALDLTQFYADTDGDGRGNAASTKVACTAPTGYVASDDDCNDASKATYPGAAEVCGGADEDCDGDVDEASATDAKTWYLDADGDGTGGAIVVVSCVGGAGYAAKGGDCNDVDARAVPGGTEKCDGIDNDCVSGVPSTEADADKDGFFACAECDDSTNSVFPGASEVCNTKDDDCDGAKDENPTDGATFYKDGDADGYGIVGTFVVACGAPTGYAAVPGDCNDGAGSVNPGKNEVCNSVDDDCDGSKDEGSLDASPWYRDADGDKHGTPTNFQLSCVQPSGFVAVGDDCLDTNAKVYPGFPEVPNDGVDQDCSGGDLQIRTCKELLVYSPGTPSGTYTLDFDGSSGPQAPVITYCDMVTDNGGWTLAGYSYMASTTVVSANQNMRSLRCGGGTWSPTARASASAAVPSVDLAIRSTEMAISMNTTGATPATGGLSAYAFAWKFTIPNPSKVHFKSHSYTYSGNWNTTDAGVGPCVPVTVRGIVGETTTYSRYTLQNVLGVTWTDTYPTGYGAGDTSNCYQENAGPMVHSIHSGSGNYPIGPSVTECDVVQGATTYSHRGNYPAAGVNGTGGAAIWFR